MASVYFSKPSRFEVFTMMYIGEQKKRRHDNSHWQSYSQCYENLGGKDQLYGIFSAFGRVSAEAQKRICGFTDADITAFLEREDAGKVYAEIILQ